MLVESNQRGGAKIVLAAALVVAAVAGIAGAMIFRSGRAVESEIAASPPATVQGTSFDQPTATPTTQAASAGTPAPTPASTLTPQTTIETPKPATAADVPLDISKIPSATPVPRVEVASVAGGSPAPQPATDSAPPADSASYKDLSFQVLAGYKYNEPVPREGAKPEEIEAERKKNQIPADVMALKNSKAVVEGWMVPMQVDDNGGVKSFVLVKTQPQCCFGDTQKMNEWIDVAMPDGKTAEFNVDRPIKVYGTLDVGEKTEDGFVLSIYRMKADKVSG